MKRVARLALALAACTACAPELGDAPALCPDGRCPEGYDCIHGVCALPGTLVPTTVAQIGGLRGGDLRLIPQSDSVLVAWESYPYNEPVGQAILARRLYPDGTLSEELVLEASWKADPGAVEPFYDILAISDEQLLVALSSSPVEGDDPRPRLRVFEAILPPPRTVGTATTTPAWDAEVRMSTIGYGNVSQPRFVVSGGVVRLGYFEGVAQQNATLGRLAVFELDEHGRPSEPIVPCAVDEQDCSPAPNAYESERAGAIAVGVAGAHASGSSIAWTIDETRPSCMLTTPPEPAAAEAKLDSLSVVLSADASGVTFLKPSARAGDQLPEDPVSGDAVISRVGYGGEAAQELGRMAEVRDNPRPAWALTSEGRGLLLTPGKDIAAAELAIHAIDTATGAASVFATIPRLSTLDLAGLQLAVVAGRLYVVWLEVAEDRAAIRAAVLDAP